MRGRRACLCSVAVVPLSKSTRESSGMSRALLLGHVQGRQVADGDRAAPALGWPWVQFTLPSLCLLCFPLLVVQCIADEGHPHMPHSGVKSLLAFLTLAGQEFILHCSPWAPRCLLQLMPRRRACRTAQTALHASGARSWAGSGSGQRSWNRRRQSCGPGWRR